MYIDMEHSPLNMETVADMIFRLVGIATIVRTPGPDGVLCPGRWTAALMGCLFPRRTREQVEQIVEWTSISHRLAGMSLRRAHSRYGKVKAQEYCSEANESTVVVIQIESKKAIDDLEQLVSVQGVDAAFIGPADLSQTYGLPGQANDPKILADLERFIKVCQDHNVVPGIHVYDQESFKKWYPGMRLFAYRNDISMLADTAAQCAADIQGCFGNTTSNGGAKHV